MGGSLIRKRGWLSPKRGLCTTRVILTKRASVFHHAYCGRQGVFHCQVPFPTGFNKTRVVLAKAYVPHHAFATHQCEYQQPREILPPKRIKHTACSLGLGLISSGVMTCQAHQLVVVACVGEREPNAPVRLIITTRSPIASAKIVHHAWVKRVLIRNSLLNTG